MSNGIIRVLTVAGSDSGGGAGIQADLKAITVLGGYGMSVIAALTAQNTLGVQGVHTVPVEFVRLQMDAVMSDIGADAVKTGMLADSKVVRAVAEGLAAHQAPNIVVDPVMAAASGDPLLEPEAVAAVKEHLMPLATVVTPNLPEAEILAGFPIPGVEEMARAAEVIRGLGPQWVLIKGGHAAGEAEDILFDGRELFSFRAPRIQTQNAHGTGCTLSAALATFLAAGLEVPTAVAEAKKFITEAIQAGLPIGKGRGPTNPFVRVQKILDREQVLTGMKKALDRLLAVPAGRLIPEIRSNLGYALAGASGKDEVAAVPGRITQIGERLVAFAEPAFGASSHVAKVILTAARHDPHVRSAMAIRYEPEILEAALKAGLTAASFDRADEPKEIKEREGSSLEWGTQVALAGQQGPVDLVFDLGDKGKEPVIRVLGTDPGDVVDKVLRIYQAGN